MGHNYKIHRYEASCHHVTQKIWQLNWSVSFESDIVLKRVENLKTTINNKVTAKLPTLVDPVN